MKKKQKVSKRAAFPVVAELGLDLLPYFAIDNRPSQSELAQYVLAAKYRKRLDGDLHSKSYSPS